MSESISWDEYFMSIANVVKLRSKDPKTKVGAVLVSMKDNRIISTGYNSLKAGLNDKLIDWNDRIMLKDIIIHAETNAILYAQSRYEDSILYCTLSPCNECIKLLSATHIKKIIYESEYRDFIKTKELCEFFKIELIQYQNKTTT